MVNEQDIITLIKSDEEMMHILRAARTLGLPDWMIGAGFVRNKVWDHLHAQASPTENESDVDLIYHDRGLLNETIEKVYERRLCELYDAPWSVKNQARMHVKHDRAEQYTSSVEALAEWVETATCVAVRLLHDDTIILYAPHGIDDLTNCIARPSPAFRHNTEDFWNRVRTKQWLKRWSQLRIVVS